MDNDLEKVLDELWKIKPKVTRNYLQIQSRLLLAQEIRNLRKKLDSIGGN